MFTDLRLLSIKIQGGFAKVFAGTLAPNRSQYAIKIVAKCSLQKPRAQQKVRVYPTKFLALDTVNTGSYN